MKKVILISSLVITAYQAFCTIELKPIHFKKVTREEAQQEIEKQGKAYEKGTIFFLYKKGCFYYVKRKFPFKAKKVKSESIVKGYHPSF